MTLKVSPGMAFATDTWWKWRCVQGPGTYSKELCWGEERWFSWCLPHQHEGWVWWCEPAAPDLERERRGHSWGSLAAELLGEFQTNESLSQKRRLIASKEQDRVFFPYTHAHTLMYTYIHTKQK